MQCQPFSQTTRCSFSYAKRQIANPIQVLAPRFKDTSRSYTRMLKAPADYEANFHDKYVNHRYIVELRGNPFPKLELPNSRPNMYHLHNFLLSAARKEAEAANISTTT